MCIKELKTILIFFPAVNVSRNSIKYTSHYAKNKEFNIFTPCFALMFEKKRERERTSSAMTLKIHKRIKNEINVYFPGKHFPHRFLSRTPLISMRNKREHPENARL